MINTECEIFKATGIQTPTKIEICKACPFQKHCPQDILDDAVSEIIEQIAKYIKNEKGKG